MHSDRLAVIGGGGQMGSGIAQVAASAGFSVRLIDVSRTELDRGLARIRTSLEKRARRAEISVDEIEATLERIVPSVELDDAADAGFIFESVPEDLGIKQATLARLDEVCRDDAVLASNTSQISITELAAAVHRRDRVIGMHWFNPPVLMALVEVVPGVETSATTVEAARAMIVRLGKQSVVCKRDAAGFLTSRLIMAFSIEAIRILEEGIADVDDINQACVLAFNHPMGPLQVADLGGLDTFERAADGLTAAYGERFRPPQLLRGLVRAGHLGRKSGKGFSDYDDT